MQSDISTISSTTQGLSSDSEASFVPLDLTLPKNSSQLPCGWNNVYAPYSNSLCIHQLFENQVQISPNAVAVIYQNRKLTYQELNARANQLAYHLRKKGVKPDVLVGICIERSLEMVIGILGILKAGAAYVPLDPDYPSERLCYMKEDAGLKIILSQVNLREKTNFDDVQILFLDDSDIENELSLQPFTNISSKEISLNSQNLAYGHLRK